MERGGVSRISNGDYSPDTGSKISRREALGLLLVGGCCTLYKAANTQPVKRLRGLITEDTQNPKEVKGLHEILVDIKGKYGLEVYNGEDTLLNAVMPDIMDATGSKVSREEAHSALAEILKALHYYPPEFFRRNGIDSIRLEKRLKRAGDNASGTVVFPNSIIMNVAYLEATDNYFRYIFHHEIFHCLQVKVGKYTLIEWKTLMNNPNAYSRPEVMHDRISSLGEHHITLPLEDQADMAGTLFGMYEHKQLLQRILTEEDPETRFALARKKGLIEDVYNRASE